MQKAVRILLLLAVALAFARSSVGAHEKQLPPAFGKELVPDEAGRRQTPEESDRDDKPASRVRGGSHHARGGPLDADGDDPLEEDDASDEPGDL